MTFTQCPALAVVLLLAEPAIAATDASLSNSPIHPATSQLTTNGAPRPGPRARVGPVHPGFKPGLPTLWLIGDSTVKNSRDVGADGLWGWGNPIASWFDRTRINVENQALGGTSSRSFITSRLWEAVREQIKPGDFVIMQFGHNDGGSFGSLPGNGEETRPFTGRNGEEGVMQSYGWYLRKCAKETKDKGGTPIICSLIPRNDWRDGKVRRADQTYGKWAQQAAEAGGAFFVDLNRLVADRYDNLGPDAVKPFFPKEHTHTSWDGAVLNAECVIEGIKALKDCSLKGYLLTAPERPKQPDAP
jgi:lysophospholipase L1-like esterase